jgi:hypothetical protein
VIGGNHFRAKPETGIYNASYGQFIEGNADGTWIPAPAEESGILTRGEIRDLEILNINGNRIMAVARNNDILEFYKQSSE